MWVNFVRAPLCELAFISSWCTLCDLYEPSHHIQYLAVIMGFYFCRGFGVPFMGFYWFHQLILFNELNSLMASGLLHLMALISAPNLRHTKVIQSYKLLWGFKTQNIQ